MGSKKLNFIIPLVVYPFDVMVSIGESNRSICERLLKLGISEEDVKLVLFEKETVQGRCACLSTNQTIIRLRHFPKFPKHYGDLQHEIFHAVSYIMERIGMPLEIEKSDEAYAYLVGYLTTEIYKKL